MKEDMSFRVDTMALLHEITDNALSPRMGIMKMPLNIFKNLLGCVAQRAIEINDPELNILMLSLNLYEVSPKDVVKAIEKQRALITKDEQP